ncbi:pyruvate dehydrogenase (acetyl-transferring) kinase, mitochondrial isoform X5 [Lingula anatina]|uniref:Protein-serine/threonine kinase n=1 Tax=Lingula anatina TaxID=7574 RepID=A0A1S3IMW8_LINAN|nr:pyruvate dehydrogenase (acetyl-transferring) kinase, mitochondrial isoform X4 [Lingula anatina]XP_013399548.1 pyruvate dehydrogenase (acetyl-transferring) kinase, mitochondrial isoform X5 [Lingula anatina]|eukprot:XP_013399547.1 pyruvate dehydrogenase (acetyl-transferring) kinase, mitochondrial isoform X4 [Lingula anatina]
MMKSALLRPTRPLGFVRRFRCQPAAISVVKKYAEFNPAPLSLRNLLDFGQNPCQQKSFKFLRFELAVRLANMLKEIEELPKDLMNTSSADLVHRWYEESFRELMEFENASSSDQSVLSEFSEALEKIRSRHSTVVETMAQGVMELANSSPDGVLEDATRKDIQYFLNRFYISRISIRMLINQHILLFGNQLNQERRYIGSIDPHCDVLEVVQGAYEDAKGLCDLHYCITPKLDIKCFNPYEQGEPIQMVYVPSHLHHIMFELFKNSMRATIETRSNVTDSDLLPHIEVKIFKGKEDITIKISDQGGGFSRDQLDLMFNYTYTTASKPSADHHTPFAGYGYGLPLSRLYAVYLNGNLDLAPVEGHGTDAYVYLKTLSQAASELLPVFNKTTAKYYNSPIPVADWSNPSHTTGLTTFLSRTYCTKTSNQ